MFIAALAARFSLWAARGPPEGATRLRNPGLMFISRVRGPLLPHMRAHPRLARTLVLHVPALAGAAKVAGVATTLLMKKFAVSRVIGKIGPERAIKELREMNADLQRRGLYSESVGGSADESLSALEGLLKDVREDDRVAVVWSWYEELEKRNPTLATAVMKSYLDAIPPLKWANVLLKGAKPSAKGPAEGGGHEHEHATKGAAEGGGHDHEHATTSGRWASAGNVDEAKQVNLIKAMHAAFPELSNYHVVLVPREDTRESAEDKI